MAATRSKMRIGAPGFISTSWKWWRVKSADFPHLAILARRVLAIPATQAESERLFSCAGNIVTKTRNRLAPSTVELLVLLRHSWKIVEEWEASNATAMGGGGGSA